MGGAAGPILGDPQTSPGLVMRAYLMVHLGDKWLSVLPGSSWLLATRDFPGQLPMPVPTSWIHLG